ncbi:hypothetical protein [Natranaerobius trueperi]|uniref:Uncharacterized protein n=1 Tax=Natranaerobius trueperi TaxID=759412 RepID=A0A226BVK4_9FIRM|nr:hypothetical protein [Natranaerobius trueperi]OWZ82792.1 hypothetical protein CDO51_12140 [Natranaerobius trueperi]
MDEQLEYIINELKYFWSRFYIQLILIFNLIVGIFLLFKQNLQELSSIVFLIIMHFFLYF